MGKLMMRLKERKKRKKSLTMKQWNLFVHKYHAVSIDCQEWDKGST